MTNEDVDEEIKKKSKEQTRRIKVWN